MTTELEPCPFCGSQPVSKFFGDEDGGYWSVECRCENAADYSIFAGVHGDDQPIAEKAWNRRALSAPEAAHPGVDADAVAWLVTWNRDEEEWVNAHANEVTAVDEARRHKGTCTPLYPHPTPRPADPTDGDIGALVERLNVAYEKVAMWPESRMQPDAVEQLGDGFIDLLKLRNLVPEAATALAAMSAKLAASEAGNTDLRRQADAMREALEPFAALASAMDRIAVEGQRRLQPEAAKGIADEEIAKLVTPDDQAILTDGRMAFGRERIQTPPVRVVMGDLRRARAARTSGGSDA